MRPRRSPQARPEAVSRRLAQLDAELSGLRADATRVRPDDDAEPGWEGGGEADWDVAPPAGTVGPPYAWEPPDSHTRPRPVPGLPEVGRHAARPPGPPDVLPGGGVGASGAAGWRAWVPETLQGRAGLGAAHVAVVAVLVSVGLGVTCWWVLRSAPEPMPAARPAGALVTPSASPSGAAPPSAAPSAGVSGSAVEAGGDVVVDVAGKVRRPGIAVLPAGSRVADALASAGGARAGVDLTSLNLARVLVDGEQVLVGVTAPAGVPGGAGTPAVPAVPGSPATPGAPAAPGSLVNINTADLALLDTLPGVGPVTAQAILDWRTENGGFTAVEDLLDVSGIGEVTLAELTPLVTV